MMDPKPILRHTFILSAGVVLLVCLSIIHLMQGQADYQVSELLTEVWKPGRVQDILLSLRLPRLMIGIVSGMALAVSGAILQTLTKNPLSSPGTLGINAGAHFFVVLTSVFVPALYGEFRLLVALIGSIVAAFFILVLSGKRLEPVRVALTGMIVSLFFSSLTGALQLLFENETNGLFLWGSGTLMQLGWSGTSFAAPIVLAALLFTFLLARQLDTFNLGEESATSLGQNVDRVKRFSWIVAIVLSSTTVSVVGPIGFIGLMAPHIAKMLGAKTHGLLFLHSVVWGAVLLIGADVLGRTIQPDAEVPVGALTAMAGAPWLLYLAWKTATQRRTAGLSLGGTPKPHRLIVIAPLFFIVSVLSVVFAISYNGIEFSLDWAGSLIQTFRMPRVLTAYSIGVVLAVCGVLLQAILRNPLADTSVIGLTSMGGAGGMIVMVLLGGASTTLMPVGIVLGTSTAIAVLLLVSWKTNFNPALVALIGIGLSAFGSAIIQILTIKAKLTVAKALVFLSGSTYAMNWGNFYLTAIVLVVFLVPIMYLTRNLDVLQYGDDVSTGLGVSIRRTRLGTILIVLALTTVSIMAVGVIGFLGLVAPHIARRLVGYRTLPLVVTSGLLGGSLLVVADLIGRTVLVPKDIPSGLVVALLGTPYLIYLLYKLKK